MTHKEYADSLRLIADWFEQHEEIPLQFHAEEFDYFEACNRTDFAKLTRALMGAKTEKVFDRSFSGSFEISRMFGAIKFCAIGRKDNVCERVVVGKTLVPEAVIPAQPETVIPSHEEEIVEWQCKDSLLA